MLLYEKFTDYISKLDKGPYCAPNILSTAGRAGRAPFKALKSDAASKKNPVTFMWLPLEEESFYRSDGFKIFAVSDSTKTFRDHEVGWPIEAMGGKVSSAAT